MVINIVELGYEPVHDLFWLCNFETNQKGTREDEDMQVLVKGAFAIEPPAEGVCQSLSQTQPTIIRLALKWESTNISLQLGHFVGMDMQP